METSLKVTSRMARSTDTDAIRGQMVTYTKARSRTASRTVWAQLSMQTSAMCTKVNGKTESVGEGVFTAANGDKYVGHYENNQRNGFGTYYHNNGDVYAGQWVNGEKEGLGKYTYANGSTYEGQFVHSNIEGRGIFVWASGATYEGQFKDDMRNGEGTYTTPSGRTIAGNWKDNRFAGNVNDAVLAAR